MKERDKVPTMHYNIIMWSPTAIGVSATFTIHISSMKSADPIIMLPLLERTEKHRLQISIWKILLAHATFNLYVGKYHAVSVTATHGSYGNKVFGLTVSINFLLFYTMVYGN